MREIIKLILLITGIFNGIIRLIRNLIYKGSGDRITRKINKNPAYLNKLTKDLVTIYNKFPITEFPRLFEKISQIQVKTQIGKFHFSNSFTIDSNNILCLTTVDDIDYGLGISGNLKDIKNVIPCNFVIRKNPTKAQYEFYSDIFDDLNEKNLKSDFRYELLKFLQENK
jgi:hypothetical protein